MSVLLFLISAVRAIIEMLGLCLLGQGMLYLIAGQRRSGNSIYLLFDLITRAPRQIVAVCLPRTAGPVSIGIATFFAMLVLWIALAFVRKIV